MRKVPHHEPSNAGIVILVLFALAAVAQCARPTRGQSPQDACGGTGSHPVTIGGVLVVACH